VPTTKLLHSCSVVLDGGWVLDGNEGRMANNNNKKKRVKHKMAKSIDSPVGRTKRAIALTVLHAEKDFVVVRFASSLSSCRCCCCYNHWLGFTVVVVVVVVDAIRFDCCTHSTNDSASRTSRTADCIGLHWIEIRSTSSWIIPRVRSNNTCMIVVSM
jgi:hypothetical protein